MAELIVSGKASATGAGWVTVSFQDSKGNYVTVPSPIVVGMVESKSGTIKRTSFAPPTIDLQKLKSELPSAGTIWTPMLDLPAPRDIAPAGKETEEGTSEEKLEKAGEEVDKEEGKDIFDAYDWVKYVPLAGSWLKDTIRGILKKILGFFGQKVGKVMDYDWGRLWSRITFWNNDVLKKAKEYCDTALKDMKTAIDADVAKVMTEVRNGFAKIGADVQTKVSDLNSKVTTHLNDVLQPAISRLNIDTSNAVTQAIVNLYESIGLPSPKNGASVPLIQPAQITNVTNTGFSFYSYGAGSILHYVAISAAPIQVIDTGVKEKKVGWFPLPFPDLSKIFPAPPILK